MTLTLVVRVLAVAVLAIGASAQQPDGQFTLGGTVTNSRTGEPVKRALVTAIHYDTAGVRAARGSDGRLIPPPPPLTSSTFTDPSGVFLFDALPPGNYSISARRPGFETPRPDNPGAPPGQVNLTSSISDLRLSLAPLGVITGTVTDQEGTPLRSVNITAQYVAIQDGLSQIIPRGSGVTDDRGIYRLWGVPAGKYYIKAAGRPAGAAIYAGGALLQSGAEETFAPAYFGGGKTMESAEPLQIEAGGEAQADFELKTERAYRIRGSLANFVPHQNVALELLNGADNVSTSQTSVNRDTGVFDIQGVIAGSYTLHATQDKSSAEVPVTVGRADVSGVVLPLASGVDLKVLTRFADEAGNILCQVPLRAAGGRFGGYMNTPQPNSPPGESTAQGVLPGTYRISIQCYGAYVRSATMGSQDLLANPAITVQPGVQPPAIEILAARGGGTVTGALSGAVKPGAGVLLVPQFQSTGPVIAQVYAPGGQAGGFQFAFRNLAPGDYLAYAFSKINDVEYRNPEVIRSLTGGMSVQVEDNKEKKIDIAGAPR